MGGALHGWSITWVEHYMGGALHVRALHGALLSCLNCIGDVTGGRLLVAHVGLQD